MPRAEPLRVVVTNDDGIDSAGLRLLAAAALRTGCKVLVAAPDHQASGSSAAMTAVRDDGRIVMERRKLAGLDTVPAYAVQAPPLSSRSPPSGRRETTPTVAALGTAARPAGYNAIAGSAPCLRPACAGRRRPTARPGGVHPPVHPPRAAGT